MVEYVPFTISLFQQQKGIILWKSRFHLWSQELFELFLDLKKMFFETGYILQQCALANNAEHFKMVLESVSCSEEDLLYVDPETGKLI